MHQHEEQFRVADNAASRTIATILRHDAKVTSYKLALIRAINEVVLSFPDAGTHSRPVAIPLRVLAEYWVAYYWPFLDPWAPISQGPHSLRSGVLANDMAFRPALSALWQAWEAVVGGAVRASDGFFLINEFRVARQRDGYPAALRRAFTRAVHAAAHSIEQPIHYAGPGEWGVFPRPAGVRDTLTPRGVGREAACPRSRHLGYGGAMSVPAEPETMLNITDVVSGPIPPCVVNAVWPNALHTRIGDVVAKMGPPPWSVRLLADERNLVTLIANPPGTGNRPHWHKDFDEWWVILAGRLRWELTGGTVIEAGKDELVWVPRGTVHHIQNVGDDLSLRMAIAMPPAVHYFSACEQCGYTDDGPRAFW